MADDDLSQISVGRFRVGIAGLQQAISEIKVLPGQSEDEIAEALLNKLKSKNYIPNPAREEYKQAFLREYRRALGEQITEDQGGRIIKIIGSGCPCSDHLEQAIMSVLAELNLTADIEHVRDLKEIKALGVSRTPALIINNQLKAMGTVPSHDHLKIWLQQTIC